MVFSDSIFLFIFFPSVLAGYYLFEAAFVYHNVAAPVVNVPGNTIQILTGALVAVPVILVVRPVMNRFIKKEQKGVYGNV